MPHIGRGGRLLMRLLLRHLHCGLVSCIACQSGGMKMVVVVRNDCEACNGIST
jgi:hypothetical protein